MKKILCFLFFIIFFNIMNVEAKTERCKYTIGETTINILYTNNDGTKILKDVRYSHHNQPLIPEKWYINIGSNSLEGINFDEIGDGLYCPRLKVVKSTTGTTPQDATVTYNVSLTNEELKYDLSFGPNTEEVIEHNDFGDILTENYSTGYVQFGTEDEQLGNEFVPNLELGLNSPQIDIAENCKSILGDPNVEKSPAWYMSIVFSVIRYASIILLIVLSVMDFVGAIASQDNDIIKKAVSKLMRRAILSVIIFVLPTILDFGLQFLHNSQIRDCINLNS